MASTSRITDDSIRRFLPQHGFGPDVNFDTITRYHPFLFRVYTPRTLSPLADDSLFFVGGQFNAKFAPRTPVMTGMHVEPGVSLLDTTTYEDCTRHLDWETRAQSPFISTSFSFGWSLWDAVRRYNTGVKHDVEIAIIDARALVGQAATAIQLLKKKPATQQHKLHWRWYRFAQESQSVLVHGFIPRSAVVASIPLLSIVHHLPSYFLKPNVLNPRDFEGLSSLAWDFADTKRCTYRKFCLDLQARFSRLPFQSRVRDLAVGSARLSIALLNPWFQEMVLDEEDPTHFDLAITRTRELAGLIAHWPEQTGSRDYAEMYGVIKGLITLVAEEARSANSRSSRVRARTASEVERLKTTVVGLEEVIRGQAIVIAHNTAELSSRPGSAEQTTARSTPKPRPEGADQSRASLVAGTHTPDLQDDGHSPSTSISPRDRMTTLKLLIPQSRPQSPSASSSSGSSPTSPLTPASSPSLHSPTPIRYHSAKAEFLPHFDDFTLTSESSSRRSSRSLAISAPPSPTLDEPFSTSPPLVPMRPFSAPPASSSEHVSLPGIYPPSPKDEVDQRPVTPSPLRISIPLSRTSATSASATTDSAPVTSASRYFTAVSEEKFSPFSPFFIVGMDYFTDTDTEEDLNDGSPSYSTSSSGSSSGTSFSSGASIFLHDAVSCAVTGFLVGAVITLYILSSQRRTLLTHLT